MAVNDLLGVTHTTVAKFDGIPVEAVSKFIYMFRILCLAN